MTGKTAQLVQCFPQEHEDLLTLKNITKREELHIKYFGNWYKPSAREADMERFRDFLVSQPISLGKC